MDAELRSRTGSGDVALLSACQAILVACNSILITLNALVGYALAPSKGLATLPVTAWVLGGAGTTYFASLAMRRTGRRVGFTIGNLLGLVGAALSCFAVWTGSFLPLCVGSVVLGACNAFGGYYRFAAAEAVDESRRARAIAYVLAGGLVGGIVGPATTKLSVNMLPERYLASYLSLLGFFAVSLVLLRFLRLPAANSEEDAARGRPLAELVRQPAFVVAALAAAFGFGVMSLLMTATPLAMAACGHAYGATTTVISSHVVGMFAPSFFTGDLIKRFGVRRILLAGAALNLACVGVAVAGGGIGHFWWALVLLGVGWNFLYVGGTTLLAETCQPRERAHAQGANELLIFLVMAVSSFSSGVILERSGWQTLNLVAVPFIVLIAAAVVWLGARERKQPAGVTRP
jgi:MFS family permease